MTLKTFDLPDVGEGLTEAEVTEWKIAPGEAVAVNDVICEIETAKSLVELSSPYAGTVSELLVAVGETIEVGTPIISVEDSVTSLPAASDEPDGTRQDIGGSAPTAEVRASDASGDVQRDLADSAAEASVPAPDMPGEVTGPLVGSGPKADAVKRRPRKPGAIVGGPTSTGTPTRTPSPSGDQGTSSGDSPTPSGDSRTSSPNQRTLSGDGRTSSRDRHATRVLAKPPVRKAARDLGVDLADVPATGSAGEVTKHDLLAYREQRGSEQDVTDSVGVDREPAAGGRTERVPVRGVRKATAQAMVRSAFTAPHVSIFRDVDASRTMEFIGRLKKSPDYDGIKVSPLLILARAVIWAAARNPSVNASWSDDEILVKHFVNLGIAAATPRGLTVPNIKDAQKLSLKELAQALNELATTARAGRTQPAQMQGGTLTITNIGALGLDTGTPIINPGEVAIVAFGTIKQKPWVVDGEVVPRWITTLGGSFDHRVVDGELSARFIADVASVLEEPALLLD
ncbi:2-oxo acid dehydrogenase subunit E2 [Arthrobacter echini]|uniref:Dihydrolipoamide acetyltransferase component of pyruvate dehydrogenase complex n=1 Tax=Arthrobacter echini TaxID=1529066 RepID=A0A4V3Z600_9MICC|nr:dihydrolipoamide acetyltransferase family protein [Arthrobacter echini]THJ68629.1 2-oxo acid dehydrogenase subunit E2 [Arthrobacter echini]